MIKDLTKIREYLNDYVEVEMPYEFIQNSKIQYITCSVDNEGNISCESFYPDCKFLRRCNDLLFIEYNGINKRVPICRRDKEGTIIYQSRFFIPEQLPEKLSEDPINTNIESKSIEYQQEIIEKLIERVTFLEIEKHENDEKISTYEELLQEGRYKLKALSIELREKNEKLNHYEELIPKLYNSR